MKDRRREIADLIEIGIKGYASGGLLDKDAYLDIADKVITKLDAMPASKEVEYAIKLVKDLRQLMLETDWGGVSVTKGAFRNALQTLIQAVSLRRSL